MSEEIKTEVAVVEETKEEKAFSKIGRAHV